MPTPDHIRQASLAKRRRVCVVCGATFHVKSADRIGRACSPEHLRVHRSRIAEGRTQSIETRRKRSESLRNARADPERNARWTAAAAEGSRRWHADDDNATAFAQSSSERMKRRHADPDWQKVRDERSSRTMKANWDKHRDAYVRAACDRYARGVGINTAESERRKVLAARWIMKHAQDALHTETDYDEVFARVQRQLRTETPYHEATHGDYQDYSRALGTRVANSPECREIADGFLSEAIPRFAAEWKAAKTSRETA